MMEPAIWTALYAERPLHEALETLSAHGWHAFEASTEHLVQIELADEPETHVEQTRRCLQELDLSMPQAHALLQADVAASDAERRQEDVRRLHVQIDVAARLGVEVVVIHPGGRQGAATASERDRILAFNVEAFRRLGDWAGEQGVRIGLENLARRGASMPYEMLDLLAAIDHPAIGFTLDTSHANMIALDPTTLIRELGSHLIATHISDNDGSGDQHRTPGNGSIDWPAVVRALREVGYDGLFNLEIPGERHALLPLRAFASQHACQVAEWLVSL
jgi:D-psicose/D-tagatose/L-ribulose 3-epimerase